MGLWLQSKIRLFFALCLLPLPTAGLIMSSGNEFGGLSRFELRVLEQRSISLIINCSDSFELLDRASPKGDPTASTIL
jgi:hypothetical protein